jgi:tetratricopeptide (TPR) repeat protein
MKKDQPNWYFSRGIVYTHKKMYKEALADFDAAIKLNPTVDGYFEDRGYALLGLGRTGEAMESFKKAAELNPSNFSSYYAMGMAQSDEGELKEAVGSFNKSIEVYKKQKLGYLDRNPKLRDLSRWARSKKRRRTWKRL